MAYKYEIFDPVNLTLHGHYTCVCTVSKVTGKNAETKYVCQTRNTQVLIDDEE